MFLGEFDIEVVEKAMKTKTIATLTAAVAAIAISGALPAAGIESLRGHELDAASAEPEKHKVEVVQGGIDRSYKEQPPMIPHEIEKYDISLRQNGCLKCHSQATYEKENAKRTPDSHFLDRDGNKLDRVSLRRYFCTQCHAVQLSGAPLVDNLFQGRK